MLQAESGEAAVSQAKAAVSQAFGRVEQLRKVGAIVTTEASLQTATNLARAEAELARAEKLAATGVVARVDLDEARRNVEIVKAQKNAAEAQRTATTPRGVDSSERSGPSGACSTSTSCISGRHAKHVSIDLDDDTTPPSCQTHSV